MQAQLYKGKRCEAVPFGWWRASLGKWNPVGGNHFWGVLAFELSVLHHTDHGFTSWFWIGIFKKSLKDVILPTLMTQWQTVELGCSMYSSPLQHTAWDPKLSNTGSLYVGTYDRGKSCFLRPASFFHLDALPSTKGETNLQILTYLIFKGLGCAKKWNNLDTIIKVT